MYGVNINGTTITVDNGAMTALKRDGSSLKPASLVNVLKGTYSPHSYLSARVRVAGVNTGRFNAVLKYDVSERLRTVLRTVRSRTVHLFTI